METENTEGALHMTDLEGDLMGKKVWVPSGAQVEVQIAIQAEAPGNIIFTEPTQVTLLKPLLGKISTVNPSKGTVSFEAGWLERRRVHASLPADQKAQIPLRTVKGVEVSIGVRELIDEKRRREREQIAMQKLYPLLASFPDGAVIQLEGNGALSIAGKVIPDGTTVEAVKTTFGDQMVLTVDKDSEHACIITVTTEEVSTFLPYDNAGEVDFRRREGYDSKVFDIWVLVGSSYESGSWSFEE